jgi:hypothetical protein
MRTPVPVERENEADTHDLLRAPKGGLNR